MGAKAELRWPRPPRPGAGGVGGEVVLGCSCQALGSSVNRGPGEHHGGAAQPLPPPETPAGPISSGVVAGGTLWWGGSPLSHVRVQPGAGGGGGRGQGTLWPRGASVAWRWGRGHTHAWGWGPAVLTHPDVRLQEAPWLLPRGSLGSMGCRGPLAGWGSPPLLPAPAAFALGRGERHRLPSPSRDSQEGARAAWVPAVVGGCGLPWAGQWARASAAWGGGGRRRRRSCSLPSPVGVCGVHRGPGATGRNRFGRPGEALSRSAGVEPGTADARCPGAAGPPSPLELVVAWVLAAGHGYRCLLVWGAWPCSVGSSQGRGSVLPVGTAGFGAQQGALLHKVQGPARTGWPGSAHPVPVPQWGRRGWLGVCTLA